MNDPSNREAAIFDGALALPAAQRAAYLDAACAGQPELRRRVGELLGANDKAEAFLDQPAGGNQPTIKLALSAEEKLGAMIGRYKLLEKVGEGGFGVVYVAEQREPVKRRVALKIIKLGMDTRQVVARFEAERQALAMMDHPNIAKVLDAGATDTGRPFFIMELVRGIRVTDYCDQNKFSASQRLNLFIQICHAIQHAHQKGIIHRDIKPSNILVTLHDGVPVPKVIDFGIAKATQGELTDKTVYTQLQQFIGTPAYMSPEQAEMSGLDVDTRSDIYALGVLLYELLTGRTPFDQKELLEAGLDQMRRMIREVEPVRPSTRVSSLLGDDRTTTALRRGLDAPKLAHLLRGDLDWIVLKCLEKDRTRRYETANGLAMDLQRYLSNEPVVARPPSKFYRFQKSVRRNKLTFAAATAVATALVIGLGASTWMFFKEKEARQRAVASEQAAETARANEAKLRQQAVADEKKATSEAIKSQQVAQFLQDMLKGVDPAVAQGQDKTMLQGILDETAKRLTTDLKDQPLVEAELRATLARVYHELSDDAKAEAMYRAALRLYESAGGDQQRSVASVLNDLGLSLVELDELPEAQRVLDRALVMNRALYGLVHTNVAASLYGLAGVAWHRGDLLQAEAKYREELAQLQQLGGEKGTKAAEAFNDLGLVLLDGGNLTESEKLFRKALAIDEEAFGEKHPEVLIMRNNLGLALWYRGDLGEAEKIYRRNLALQEKVMGETNPSLAYPCNNLALVLRDRGELADAEKLHRRVLELLGEKHPLTGRARINLAIALRGRGAQSADAAPLREALRLNPTDPLTADAFASLSARPSLTPLTPELEASPPTWRYANTTPDANWAAPDFVDAAWLSAPAVFGSPTFFPRTPKTPITVHTNLWLRREFELASVPAGKIMLRVSRNHDAQIFLNGIQAAPVADWSDTDVFIPCSQPAQATLKPGRNVLAVHCVDADGGARIEVGIFVTQDAEFGRKELIAELIRLIGQEPQRADLYAARASALARLGQANKAVADLSRAVELKPDAASYSYQLAPLLVESGDLSGYRRLRQAALDRFTKPDDSIVAQQIAELCLLAPAEGAELAAAGKLAEAASAAEYPDWNLPWRQLTKGLAEYRAGRFASAIEWMNKALATGAQQNLPAWNHERERNHAAAAYLVQALAHEQLGRTVEARAAFEKGNQIVQTQLPPADGGDVGREWPDLLIARILLREASGVIVEKASSGGPGRARQFMLQ